MAVAMDRRTLLWQLGLGCIATGSVPLSVQAAEELTGGDPLKSMQWPSLRKQYLGNAPMRFSNEVVVTGPAFADDARNVPVSIDARALSSVGGGVERINVVSDRNPVREVLSFEPRLSLPVLAFRFRLEQASPLRAMVKTRDGQWHVGSTWVQAAGGGCTVPGITRADGSWNRTLNQVQTRFFNNVLQGSQRLRIRIMHPMDTGLVAGIPAFYVERLQLVDDAERIWWQLEMHEPVAENPLLTFELPKRPNGILRLMGRDNNGNPINAEVSA